MSQQRSEKYFTDSGWAKYDPNTGEALPPLLQEIERCQHRLEAALTALAAARTLRDRDLLIRTVRLARDQSSALTDALEFCRVDLTEPDPLGESPDR